MFLQTSKHDFNYASKVLLEGALCEWVNFPQVQSMPNIFSSYLLMHLFKMYLGWKNKKGTQQLLK